MRTQILSLISVIPRGVFGPECGAISLIYTFLLQEHGITHYNNIFINQVDDEIDEKVQFNFLGKKNVYVSVLYPAPEDYESKLTQEKNMIRLEIIHEGLLRLAKQDIKIDLAKLEAIKHRIIQQNFSFELLYKAHSNRSCPNLVGKILINPFEDRFDYYVVIEEGGVVKCKNHIYSSIPVEESDGLFFYGKWKGANELVIAGKESLTEIRVLVESCSVTYINRSRFDKDPYFELKRAGLTKEEREKAYQNWMLGLPPAITAAIDGSQN